jgi:hypothetical protein
VRFEVDEPLVSVNDCHCGMSAFDADPGIRPQARHHVGTAAVWEPIPDDGLLRHVGGRT